MKLINTLQTASAAAKALPRITSRDSLSYDDGGANENAPPARPAAAKIKKAMKTRPPFTQPNKSGRRPRSNGSGDDNSRYRTAQRKRTNVETRKEPSKNDWDETLTPLEIADDQRSVGRFATDKGVFWSNGIMWGEVGSVRTPRKPTGLTESTGYFV